MRLWKKTTAIAALAVAAGFATPVAASAQADEASSTVTYAPASAAVEPCKAGWLCLYVSRNYVNMKFQTQRHNSCWILGEYGLYDNILSYMNNLNVYAHLYREDGSSAWNIRNGGHDGDSSERSGEYKVCTD